MILDYFKFQVGEYVEAHEDPDIININWSHTYLGIYVGPTGNVQGTHVKKHRSATAFPMPDCIIHLLNTWGRRSRKEGHKNKIECLNRHCMKYDWDNDKLNEDEGLVEMVRPELPAQLPGIDLAAEKDGEGTMVVVVEPSK